MYHQGNTEEKASTPNFFHKAKKQSKRKAADTGNATKGPARVYRLGKPHQTQEPLAQAMKKAIYGRGAASAREACRATGRNPRSPMEKTTDTQRVMLGKWLTEQAAYNANRKRREAERAQRHRTLGTYRGQHRRRGLPVNGQRTSTNAKTARRRNRSRAYR